MIHFTRRTVIGIAIGVIVAQTLFSSVYAASNTVANGYTLSTQDGVIVERASKKLENFISKRGESYRQNLIGQLERYRDARLTGNARLFAIVTGTIDTLKKIVPAVVIPAVVTPNDDVAIDKFLADISEKVTTEDFRSKIAQSIYKVWGLEGHNDYMSLYDLLPSFNKEILSLRYGIKNRVSFNENVGSSGLNFKFTPYDFIDGKYIPFSSGTLAIVSKPTKDDIVMDASGALIGIQVSVWIPGMVTSSAKAGTKEYGKDGGMTNVFISKTGEILPTYFGLIRTLATGGGIEIHEFFKTNKNKTAFFIGKTQGSTTTDNQAKIFGKLYGIETENSIHGITAVIKNSKGEVVGTIEGVQDENVENGFISGGFATGLIPNEEYSLEIRSTFDIKYYGMGKATLYKTVKFRY